jgi:hypothetical protein
MSAEPLMSENKIRKETAKAIMQPAEDALKKFEPLLSRISAETLVLHFACWLEKKYFEVDESFFYENFLTYRHVLQKCLKLCMCGETKSVSELNSLANQYFKYIYYNKALDKDTTELFDVTLNCLITDAHAEVYRQSGRMSEGNSVILPESLWQDEGLRAKKSFIFHSFEFGTGNSKRDGDFIQSISDSNLSHETAAFRMSQYFGARFLERACGSKILEQFQSEQLWNPINALSILLVPYFCYYQLFWKPRLEAKNCGNDFLVSIKQEVGAMFFWRSHQLFGVKPLSFFREATRSFFNKAGKPFSDSEVDAVFAEFSADIHDENAINIKDGKEFLLLKNASGYLFMPRFFIHDSYIIETVYDLIFKKSEQALSKYFEEWIGSLFESAQFKVRCEYPIGNGRSLGDIDIIAYKANTLFVIQAKLTKIRHLINNIYWLPEKFEKGGEQLNTTLQWLKKPENQTKVAKELGIATPFKELRIAPLIVSNSLEHDHKYFKGHLKISAFELESAVLNLGPGTIWELNQKYQLYRGLSECAASINSAGRKTDPISAAIDKFLLYPETRGKRYNTADETIRCIEEQRLWRLVLNEELPRTPIPTCKLN